jgi:hypothetical protein
VVIMNHAPHLPIPVLDRLVTAVNGHDLESLVACFAADYANETPAHPSRGFRGRDQVRSNWTRIFAGVPDVHARVSRTVVEGSTVWTEWELAGTRGDATAFLLRGVIIFHICANTIQAATFYLEPVDETGGDAHAAIGRVLGDPAGSKETS